MKILTDKNTLDRKKMKKPRVGNKNVLAGKKENVGIFCLGFDGRKSKKKQAWTLCKRSITLS